MKKDLRKVSSRELIEELCQNTYFPNGVDGQVYEIPVNGSLGLLAAGYTGIIAWRKKRSVNK